MKKTILFLFLITLAGISRAQQPIDSLYLWVNFQKETIVIDIPKDYFTLRTVVPKLPGFVAVRKLNILVPPLPQNDILLQSFHDYLTKTTEPADNYERLDWLRVMALYLYFSRNDHQQFFPEITKVIEVWKQTPEAQPVKSEVLLIENWMKIKTEL